MAETKRTLAELKALLADNLTRDIDPVVIREFAVSHLGESGCLYADPGADSKVGNTWEEMGTWTNHGGSASAIVLHPPAGKIIIETPGDYLVCFNGAIACDDLDTVAELKLYRNGSPAAGGPHVRFMGAEFSAPFTAAGIITCGNNDGLQVWGKTDGAAETLLTYGGFFWARRVS